MKKLKIGLLVEGPDVVGGIQSAARRHVKLLRDEFEIVPIAFETTRGEADWSGRREKLVEDGGVAYRIFAADLKSDNLAAAGASAEHFRHDMRFRSFADHLIAVIEDEGIDMLNAFGLFHQRGMIAAFAAAKCGIPYLLSFRGVDLETRIFDEKSLPHVHAPLAGAQAIVCVSDDSARLLERLFRPSCPVHVARNGFDPSVFARGEVSLPLLAGSSLPVVGCFGKFRRVTGLDFLLQSFEQLNRERPAILLLAGGFQKREVEYYNGLIDRLSCAANVLRVGHVEHSRVLDYMRLCDVVAFPSISDASPNKVLEAMYAQVPIISTKVGGIPELVTDGEDALLVRPRTVEPLTRALRTILDRPELAARLVRSAYAKVTTRFTPESETPQWTEIYRRSHESFRPAAGGARRHVRGLPA